MTSRDWNLNHATLAWDYLLLEEGGHFSSTSEQRESEPTSYLSPTVPWQYHNIALETDTISKGIWSRKTLWSRSDLKGNLNFESMGYLLKQYYLKLEETELTLILKLSLPSSSLLPSPTLHQQGRGLTRKLLKLRDIRELLFCVCLCTLWRPRQVTPGCAALACRLFQIEDNQRPNDSGRNFDLPIKFLKEMITIDHYSIVWTRCGRQGRI